MQESIKFSDGQVAKVEKKGELVEKDNALQHEVLQSGTMLPLTAMPQNTIGEN